MNNQSLVEEKGLRMIPLDPGKDADLLADFTDSPSFARQYLDGIFKPCAVSEVNEMTKAGLNKDGDDNSKLCFAIRQVESGEVIGLVSIGDIFSSHQTAWINIVMAADDVFNAYACDVLRLALRYGFTDLELYRVCVEIPSYNEAEIALYEEAGFLRESQRRQAVYYNGAYYDDLLYGILRSEWIKTKQEVA